MPVSEMTKPNPIPPNVLPAKRLKPPQTGSSKNGLLKVCRKPRKKTSKQLKTGLSELLRNTLKIARLLKKVKPTTLGKLSSFFSPK
jgi:hypothetical protein